MKQYVVEYLPENEWSKCKVCNGTGRTEMTRDLHRSAGIIPCPNHHCHKGTIKTKTIEFNDEITC